MFLCYFDGGEESSAKKFLQACSADAESVKKL